MLQRLFMVHTIVLSLDFRRYRDYYLDKNIFGRLFIKIYYAISPTLVKWFGKAKWFKKLIKPILEKKIKKLKDLGYSDTAYDDKY